MVFSSQICNIISMNNYHTIRTYYFSNVHESWPLPSSRTTSQRSSTAILREQKLFPAMRESCRVYIGTS